MVSRRGGLRKGSGRKASAIPNQKRLVALTPKAIALYETQPRGRKGDWVSRLIELNASAAIEPGTLVRPVGGVSTGTVVFGDDREVVVRWPSGLRVHQMDELEVVNKGEDPC